MFNSYFDFRMVLIGKYVFSRLEEDYGGLNFRMVWSSKYVFSGMWEDNRCL